MKQFGEKFLAANKLKEGVKLQDPAQITKLIEAATDHETIANELKALSDQRDKLIKEAFTDPLEVPEMVKFTFVVGGGSKVRQKYDANLTK